MTFQKGSTHKAKADCNVVLNCCKSAFYKEPHRWNKTKLLVTGFECSDIFVIRCSDKSESRRLRPAIDIKNGTRFLDVIDEFPNRPMRQ